MHPTSALAAACCDRFAHVATVTRRGAGSWLTGVSWLLGGAWVAGTLLTAACGNGCNNDHLPTSILPTPTGGGGQGGSAGGAGGEGGAAVCGDGVKEPNEACEGADVGGATCLSLGLGAGVLTCTAECMFDISACNSNENCFDGQDNDGDGLRDCDDPDCTAACADSCASPVPLDLPAFVAGDTAGHASTLDSSCAAPSGSGPEVVYQLTAATDGVVDLTLVSQANLTLSARSTCSAAAPELGCANLIVEPPGAELLTVPVSAQDVLFVVVDGNDPEELGIFTLDARLRVPSCGDGHIDAAPPYDEQCDDGNTHDGDGCHSDCTVETTEHEQQNDTSAGADVYPLGQPYWYARIDDILDKDYLSVVVSQDGSSIDAQTFDLGDGGGCLGNQLDTTLDIYGPNSASPPAKASDDNGGVGTCSHVAADNLSAGTYYVLVQWGHTGSPPPLAYALQVVVTP